MAALALLFSHVMPAYRTKPLATPHMPPGIPYIIANEAAERFSFYGMRGILTVFMTKHLLDSSGALATMSDQEAAKWMHLFVWAVYLTPILGAFIADRWWGKYRTIIVLSIVYCLGHLALALDVTRLGLFLGLLLISLGAGGIKGCVSAHVGDQFGTQNAHLLPRVYQWFYFSINLGSATAFLIIPRLLNSHGPHWAFGVPGLLMLLATLFFWMGRRSYAHVPAKGPEVSAELKSPETWRILGRLVPIFLCITIFWSLFDQTSSHWVLQAEHMDRTLFGYTFDPSELQAFNPFFVMLLIPFCGLLVYPAINAIFPLTPLRKVGLGLFIAIPSFIIPAWLETRILAGETPSIGWQVLAYFFITLAEVMISVTSLEFSYTQAPRRLKSLVLGLYFLSVSLGNLLTALCNSSLTQIFGENGLQGPAYYWFFTGAMTLAAICFVFIALRYQPRTYLQDEEDTANSNPQTA